MCNEFHLPYGAVSTVARSADCPNLVHLGVCESGLPGSPHTSGKPRHTILLTESMGEGFVAG